MTYHASHYIRIFTKPMSLLHLPLYVVKTKRTSEGLLAPACCSMLSRRVDGGRRKQRSINEKAEMAFLKVK